MDAIAEIILQMRNNARDVRFTDLCRVCDYYFGPARHKGSSHRIYKTPWPGDPRVNIHNDRGKTKAYQVKQVLRAIDLLEVKHDTEK